MTGAGATGASAGLASVTLNPRVKGGDLHDGGGGDWGVGWLGFSDPESKGQVRGPARRGRGRLGRRLAWPPWPR